MQRLGISLSFVCLTLACDRSESTTPPEPEPTPAAVEPAEPEASEPEPEVSAPEPEAEPEVTEFTEAVFSKEGFEARNLSCKFPEPTRPGPRYIRASLVDEDAALDACAPKGAVIDVEWAYLGSQTSDIAVSGGSSREVNCVAGVIAKVRAGVVATCSATLLIGDTAAATAAFDAR